MKLKEQIFNNTNIGDLDTTFYFKLKEDILKGVNLPKSNEFVFNFSDKLLKEIILKFENEMDFLD